MCIKRLFDIIAGLFGTILLIPISICIKIAYLCTGDFGSIFYSQKRVGKDGKVFKIYKYRSMIPDADKALKNMLKQQEYHQQWNVFQKIDDDPRITKIGKYLRKGSIDELPQFVNVLLGQMSMVGPRPLIVGELEDHHGNAKKYHSVKPGITGYWAMRIRSDKNSDYDERLKLEYFYIENQSMPLDAKIIFKTIGTVLRQEKVK